MTVHPITFDSSLQFIQHQLSTIDHHLRITRDDAVDEKVKLLFRIGAVQNHLISENFLFFSRPSYALQSTSVERSIDKKIQTLVKKCLSHLSDEQLGHSLKRVARSGESALIRTVIKVIGAPLPPPSGILGKIGTLLHLNKRNFSTEAMGAAIVEAASQGHEDIVIYLVNTSQSIPNSFLGNAVHSAASKGYKNITSFLLSEGRNISPEDRRLAIINASAGGFVDVLSILLYEDDRSSPLEMDMTIPLQAAAEAGHIDATEFLLSISPNISMYFMGYMFIRAVFHGHMPIAQLLLARYSDLQHHVDPIARNEAIVEATRDGRIASLRMLLQLGPILSGVRDQALLNTSWPHRERALQAFSEVQVIDSYSLEQMETLPNKTFVTCHDDIKSNPQKYLEIIYREGLPERIRFSESPQAVDLGGLSKHFISELCSALIANNAFYLNSEGIPFTEEKDLSIFTFMGRFISLIHERNGSRSDKYLTGQIFNLKFFELVYLLHASEPSPALPHIAEHLKTLAPHYSAFFDVLMDLSEEKKLACIRMSEELYLDIDANVIKTAERICLNFVRPASFFFIGLSNALKNKIVSSGAEAFSICIQGANVSRESLIGILHIKPSVQVDFKRYVQWIIAKVHTADDLWLKLFLHAITGKNAVHPGMKINILPSPQASDAFSFQTCHNNLYIPCHHSITQTLFLAGLDAAIGVDGFNTA